MSGLYSGSMRDCNAWVLHSLTGHTVFHCFPDVTAHMSRGLGVESADCGLLADAAIAKADAGPM